MRKRQTKERLSNLVGFSEIIIISKPLQSVVVEVWLSSTCMLTDCWEALTCAVIRCDLTPPPPPKSPLFMAILSQQLCTIVETFHYPSHSLELREPHHHTLTFFFTCKVSGAILGLKQCLHSQSALRV